jgi:multiple sugar transport system substrate-binding protein
VEDPAYLGGFYDENPLLRAEIEQFSDVVQWVSWPGRNGLEIEQVLLDFRDRILAGVQEVPSAAAETAAKVNRLLQG